LSIDAATVLLTAAARLEELASSAARCLLVAGSLQASNRQLLAGCRRDVVARKFLNLLLLLLTALLEGRAGAVSSDDLDARDAAVNLTSRATVLPELASGTSAVDLSVETLAGSAASSELVSRTAVVSLLASRTSTARHITLVLEGLAGTAASRTAVLPGLTSGTAAFDRTALSLEGLAGAAASSELVTSPAVSVLTSRASAFDWTALGDGLAGGAASSELASRTAVFSLLASRTSTPRQIILVLEGLAGTAASRTAVLPGLTSGTAALSYSTLEGLAGASASSGRTVASEPTSRTLLLDEVVVEALAGAAADSDSALTGLLT